jgi:hypothetical protein
MLQKAFIFIALFTVSFIETGRAQQQENTNVRLARIEEAIKVSHQQINDTNQPFVQLRCNMQAGFNRLAILMTVVIGLQVVTIGRLLWFAYQNRPISIKQYHKLLQQDKKFVERINEFKKEQQTQRRRQEELAGVVQQANRDLRLEELAQKLCELEAEVAALKRPAT